MRRLLLSAAGFAGVLALIVGLAAYNRTFHPHYATSRPYDREPY